MFFYCIFCINNINSLSNLDECFTAINKWMFLNVLPVNPGKAEVPVFGPESVSHYITSLTNSKNLIFVIFDQKLSFASGISKCIKSCFLQLRNIAKKNQVFILYGTLSTLIFFCLFYCSSFFPLFFTLFAKLPHLANNVKLLIGLNI